VKNQADCLFLQVDFSAGGVYLRCQQRNDEIESASKISIITGAERLAFGG
jgi:hypothetical protein